MNLSILSILNYLKSHKDTIRVSIELIGFLLLAFMIYHYVFNPSQPIQSLSQKQAETVQGQAEVFDKAQVPISICQAKEFADEIIQSKYKEPDNKYTFTPTQFKNHLQQEAAKNDAIIVTDAKDPNKKVDIKNLPTNTPIVVNEYNEKAFPGHLVTVGANKNAEMIGYSIRTNVPKIPLIVPHGAVGYVGVTAIHINKPNNNEILATITVPI